MTRAKLSTKTILFVLFTTFVTTTLSAWAVPVVSDNFNAVLFTNYGAVLLAMGFDFGKTAFLKATAMKQFSSSEIKEYEKQKKQ